MRWFDALFRKGRLERQLDAELRFHLQEQISNYVASGMSPEEARRQARLEFGGEEQIKEECREVRRFHFLETIAQDLRYAARQLRRSPGFSIAAVLSLALGIGANTAIFGLLDAVLLKFLPVRAPEKLVAFGRSSCSYPAYRFYCENNPAFAGILATGGADPANVMLEGEAEEARVELVSGNFFSVVGVAPALGRTLTADDEVTPGAHAVAVLNYGYWRRRFGRDPAVVGRTIRINQHPFTIVGVAPAGFFGVTVGSEADVWAPLTMQAQVMPGREWLTRPNTNWLQVVARLKPDVTVEQAQAAMQGPWLQFELQRAGGDAHREILENIRKERLRLLPASQGLSRVRGRFGRPLRVLMVIAGLILVIACANLANLLLARSSARRREIGVRLALGASRSRLVRQALTESLLLSMTGGAVGLLLAQWANHVLLRLASDQAQPLPLHLGVDGRLLAFTAAVSALTCLLFGLAPALRSTKMDINAAIKWGGVDAGSRPGRLGRLLVVTQVSVSVLLVIGAGLFLGTLRNLRSIEMGLEPENLLVLDVNPTAAGYKGEAYVALCRRLLDRLAGVPGVKAVSLSGNGVFLGRNSNVLMQVEGFIPRGIKEQIVDYDVVGPHYFATLGTPLLLGRDFLPEDIAKDRKVVVVNESMAKFYFPGQNPVGRWIARGESPAAPKFEIVGVCRDARGYGLRARVPRQVYFPHITGMPDLWTARFLVRTAADPARTLELVRQAARAEDRALPMPVLETVTTLLDRMLVQERMTATLSGFFGGLALLLAAVGLYGVIAYSVARRTREIGIRMALGAQRAQVVRLVVWEALVLVSMGIGVGVVAAVGTGRYVSSLLYGLTPADPATFLTAIAAFLITASLAAVLPARRGARVDPTISLRYE